MINRKLLEKEGVEITKADVFPYSEIDFNGKPFLLTQNKEDARVRTFKVLKETGNVFFLCADNTELSDCGADTFIYDKKNLKLQRVQRAFSFSLKRNLIKRLNDMNIELTNEQSKLNFNQITESLSL